MKKTLTALFVLIGAINAQSALQADAFETSSQYTSIRIGCGRDNPKIDGNPLYLPEHWTTVKKSDFTVDLEDRINPHMVGNCWNSKVVLGFPRQVDSIKFDHVGLRGFPIDIVDYLKKLLVSSSKEEVIPFLRLNCYSKPEQVTPLSLLENPAELFSTGEQCDTLMSDYYGLLKKGGSFEYESLRSSVAGFYNFELILDHPITEKMLEDFSLFISSKSSSIDIPLSTQYGSFLGSDFSQRIKRSKENGIFFQGFFMGLIEHAHRKILEANGFKNCSAKFNFIHADRLFVLQAYGSK